MSRFSFVKNRSGNYCRLPLRESGAHSRSETRQWDSYSTNNSHCNQNRISDRSAMTLLELVVVMGILALLAGVAVQSLDPIANQSRYEATQLTLNHLRAAIIGDSNTHNVNGQKIISGILADTGVLPTSLNQLQQKDNALVDYGTISFDSDRDTINDITLARGWNGPYLNLGAGLSGVLDGWGHAPIINNNSGVLSISSLGSDNDSVAPETGYQEDIAVEVPVNSYSGDVVFHLYAISINTGTRVDATLANLLDGIAIPPPGTKLMGVQFYAKNATGGSSGEIQELMCLVPMSGGFDYRISAAMLGAAAARAVFWVDTNNDQLLTPGEDVLRKSCVQVFDIIPGHENRFEMELR